nr:mycothiol synthase [Pseudoclavibacter sp. 13-3]
MPALRDLAARAFRADGAQPFNDHSWSQLTEGQATVALVHADETALAAAAVVTGDEFELVVAPDARRQGLGTRLWQAAVDAGGRLIWAHGGLAAAHALAAASGAISIRELLLMQLPHHALRELADSGEPARALPDGLTLRMLRPGRDDRAWLDLNARAFAAHPEQGRITADDLAALQHESWYSPDDVLLLWQGDELVGFNWTKIAPGPDDSPEGEIYAIAVSPDHSGRGLGRVLMEHGLRHLAERVAEVSLYVEADNMPALALYRRLGFEERSRDIHWQVR